MSSATPDASPIEGSSIHADEDTTLTPEAMASRPEYKRRRHRRRLSVKIRQQVMRNNVVRAVLAVALGLCVIAASTYLAHKSTEFDLASVARGKR
jgi:hypothetical protein